jgi:hypothetical protein
VKSGADGVGISGKTQTEGAFALKAAGAPAIKAAGAPARKVKNRLSAQRMEVPSARKGAGLGSPFETWFISIPLVA